MHALLQTLYRGANPKLSDFVSNLTTNFNLLAELQNTPQDKEWHAEGNVFIHTERVLNEVYQLLATKAAHLDQQKRFILILSAIFHDIAKPFTTHIEEISGKEHIISPRHADKGRSYLAFRLLDVGIPADWARSIMALVGHHHDPKKLVLKDAPLHSYRRLARLVDIEMLYYLELADLLGRECQDKKEQLEHLEFFRLQAEEYGVWQVDNPYKTWQNVIATKLVNDSELTKQYTLAYAVSEAEAGIIFTPEEALARTFEKRQHFSQLYVMCGPSGAGKSTWIKNNLPDYHVVSLDDLREKIAGKRSDQSKNGEVLQAAREKLKEHLRQKQKVVWDATSLRYLHRNKVLQLGFDYGALVTLVVFHKPSKHFFTQDQQRSATVGNKVIAKQLEHTEFPYENEAHQTIYLD